MSKISTIIKREYLVRVKKKSFLILTILMPILMAGIMVLPGLLAMQKDKETRTIAVMDESGLFVDQLKDSDYTFFKYIDDSEYSEVKENPNSKGYYALLDIPADILESKTVNMFAKKQITLDLKNNIDGQLERFITDKKKSELIAEIGIADLEERLNETKTRIKVVTAKLDDSGKAKKSSSELAMGIGYATGFLIYMFVFMYGSMVMRGVQEEKQSRIVEVIISSAKPIELMIGKIVGIAMVGLTQFMVWIILTLLLTVGVTQFILPDGAMEQIRNQNLMETTGVAGITGAEDIPMDEMTEKAAEIFGMVQGVNVVGIVVGFIVFFILGYLMYSSLMAAIAAAVDNEEDMNQFMLPVTIPLIASMIMLVGVFRNPEGPLAFWGSIIPFSSPIIMMVRIPFGVPTWELVLSLALLVATTIGAMWVAAKIYRTGILMYGKKPSFKELGKWLKYRS